MTKSKGGRPLLYRVEYCEQARKLCLLGAIDSELADFFEVTDRTLRKWKNEFPEFAEALQAGKRLANANVADRLYQRAMGYEHDEVALHVVGKDVVKTPIKKVYPPDTVACIFWLKNRELGKWRDKVEQDVKVTQRSLADELAELNGKSSTASH